MSAPASVARAITRAREERDAGMATAEANASDWDRSLVDQAIDAFAEYGRPFSANDLRELLPDVPAQLLGARFFAAVAQRRVVTVGSVPSTLASTHAKRIGLYLGAKAQAALVRNLEGASSPLVGTVTRILADEYGPVTTVAGARRRHRIGEAIASSLLAGS